MFYSRIFLAQLFRSSDTQDRENLQILVRRTGLILQRLYDLGFYSSPVIVGIALLPFDVYRLYDLNALIRVLSLGTVVSILAFTFEQSSTLSRDRIAVSAVPRPLRILRSIIAIVCAFSVIAAVRALVVKAGTVQTPLELWCLLSVVTVGALRLVPTKLSTILLVGAPLHTNFLKQCFSANKLRSDFTVVGIYNPQDEHDLNRLSLSAASTKNALIIVAPNTDPADIDATCSSVVDSNARVVITNYDQALLQSHFAASALATALGFPIIDVMPAPIQGWNQFIKRSLDVFIVLLILPVLAPLLFIVAIAIKMNSPGPVLFWQLRFGQRSKPVWIAKFRTMRHDRRDISGERHTIARDPRVTSVGRILRRLSIDELPQLLSILRGDMSLVGPRPHPTGMRVAGELYDEAVKAYRVRHRFTPGLTGWAQINGSRGEVDSLAKAQRRVALDLWYLSNWSPLLDVWIILKTAFGGFATLHAD